MDIALAVAMTASAAVLVPALKRAWPEKEVEPKKLLCRTGLKWSSEEDRNALARKLAQAGIEEPPEWFAGLRIALPAGFALLCLPLLILGLDFFWVVFLAPVLYLLPGIWLNGKIDARKSAVKLSLSDFSVLLSTALAAGADPATALREAGESIGGPLGQEVRRVLQEHAVGRSLTDALTDMAERVDVDELRALVRTIVQAYRYGAPLAETMRAHAEQMRTVRRFEVMEAAGKLTVKMTVPVLIFMLLPCLIALGYPAGVALLRAFE